MKTIKSFILICIFGSLPESIISLFIAITALFAAILGKSVQSLILFLVSIGIDVFIVNIRTKHFSIYFSGSQSFLFPELILITQSVDKKNLNNKLLNEECPKRLFADSIKKMLDMIESDKIYICYTQEGIANIIRKRCNVLFSCEGNELNLKRLGRKIANKRCKTCCKKESCTVGKNEKRIFFALAFKSKDRLSK